MANKLDTAEGRLDTAWDTRPEGITQTAAQ